jgi:hypothetical protein
VVVGERPCATLAAWGRSSKPGRRELEGVTMGGDPRGSPTDCFGLLFRGTVGGIRARKKRRKDAQHDRWGHCTRGGCPKKVVKVGPMWVRVGG